MSKELSESDKAAFETLGENIALKRVVKDANSGILAYIRFLWRLATAGAVVILADFGVAWLLVANGTVSVNSLASQFMVFVGIVALVFGIGLSLTTPLIFHTIFFPSEK